MHGQEIRTEKLIYFEGNRDQISYCCLRSVNRKKWIKNHFCGGNNPIQHFTGSKYPLYFLTFMEPLLSEILVAVDKILALILNAKEGPLPQCRCLTRQNQYSSKKCSSNWYLFLNFSFFKNFKPPIWGGLIKELKRTKKWIWPRFFYLKGF